MNLYAQLLGQRSQNLLLQTAVIFAATLLIALSAKIKVPFYPVPMTMQTAAILGLASVLGFKRATLMIMLYMAEGAIGLPVFAGTPERGIGLAYMAGPTGGYLVGFVVAAMVCGYFADRGWSKGFVPAFMTAILGTAIIFSPGLVWLGVLFGFSASTLESGLYPFLWGALFKTLLVASILTASWSLLNAKGK